MNSVSSRAGTVMVPSPSTIAPTHVVMAISRFVAARVNWAPSVVISTFCVIGSVVRVATALPTVANPLAKFSCKQESCIPASPI